MALSGKKDPQLNTVHVGSTRGEIELHMGQPVETSLVEGKILAIYAYEEGNDASPGRAIGHGVMDILTFGLWEVVGTPIEGLQGTKKYLSVIYDENGKAEKIGSDAPSSTPAKPSPPEKKSSEK